MFTLPLLALQLPRSNNLKWKRKGGREREITPKDKKNVPWSLENSQFPSISMAVLYCCRPPSSWCTYVET